MASNVARFGKYDRHGARLKSNKLMGLGKNLEKALSTNFRFETPFIVSNFRLCALAVQMGLKSWQKKWNKSWS